MKTFPKPLTPGEEKQYLERCLKGDLEARNVLIERNMRLVAHVAKKYQNTDYDMEDLLSVGTIGLIKAVSTFHPDRAPAWLLMRRNALKMLSSRKCIYG